MKAFLRSMTMRATALTAKVRTNSTRPAAMKAPVFSGLSTSDALLAIREAKVSPPMNRENYHGAPPRRMLRSLLPSIWMWPSGKSESSAPQ